MTPQKKILILYTTVGFGHKTIAENIGSVLAQAGYEVQLADVLEVQKGKLVSVGVWLHQFVNKYLPFLWSFLYRSAWFTQLSLPYRLKVAENNHSKTLQLVEQFAPDIVITTQTSASAIIAFLKLKNLYKGLFGVAFSDFHLHEYWLYDQANFYLANTSEQKNEMLALGIPEKKIFVCGMTLPPKQEVDVSKIREKFTVEQGQKVILISSGSLGLTIDEKLLKAFSRYQNVRVIVVTGKNESLFKYLNNKFAGSNVTVLGYYTAMQELYAIANLFITKPGGLSVSEALQWNVPILISHLLPGQEELNYAFLQEKGLVMQEPFNIEEDAREELDTATFKKNLAGNTDLKLLFPEHEVLLAAISDVFNSK